jgi:hypothetical protein
MTYRIIRPLLGLLGASTFIASADAQRLAVTTPVNSVPALTPSLVWFPELRALRFGEVSESAVWSPQMVGPYSFAAGFNSVAGFGSFAFGSYAAAASESFVFGAGASATASSIAVGSAASGHLSSISIGSGASSANFSLSVGEGASSLGHASVALGASSAAAADGSSALGPQSSAVGLRSAALGNAAMAVADQSIAVGPYALATAQGSAALGYANASVTKSGGLPSPGHPQPEDPILMIGSGTGSPIARANALTVFRDGDAHFAGAVRVPPRGDVPMGGFTAKPPGVQYP